MEINKLRLLIKETVAHNLKEIEEAAENAAIDAKSNAYTEAIERVKKKIETAENREEMQELVDPAKLNELKKHLKELEKSKLKLEKLQEKKNKKKVVTDEPTEESTVDETYVDETDMTSEMYMDEESQEEALNESFLKMQKLAGVITEAQYNEAFDQKMTDIAMGFANTDPKNTPGATAGTPPKKEDTNVKTIMTRLKPLVAQLRANDTTNEFFDLLKSMIDLIQSINKDALSDTEVVMGLNNLLVAKRKEIANKK